LPICVKAEILRIGQNVEEAAETRNLNAKNSSYGPFFVIRHSSFELRHFPPLLGTKVRSPPGSAFPVTAIRGKKTP
jgi:hypothetical protein